MKKGLILFFCLMLVIPMSAQYVDLGLPSGTLWKVSNEDGFYTYPKAVSKFGKSLPTKEQLEELERYCDWKWGWTFKNGKGCTVTGRNGNQIFFPASGYRDRDTWQLHCEGDGAWIWSSTYEDQIDAMEGTIPSGWIIMCRSYNPVQIFTLRISNGCSVRLVK